MIGVGVQAFVAVNILLAIGLFVLSRAIGRSHKVAATNTLRNLPPVVTEPLDDMVIPGGQISHLQLSAETFTDPDVGDALRYQAFATHSSRLPAWIKFDGLNRRFEFSPPARGSESLCIRVVARDFEGLEAELSFRVSYAN